MLPTVDKVEASPEPGAAELLTLAVSETLQLDVETVRDAEQQPPRPQLKPSESFTNEQPNGKLDDEYIVETKNYKTRILKLQESVDEINANVRKINSRISIAEWAAKHLKNLQPYLDINENYFLAVFLDPEASIQTNRDELRKLIREEKTRRDKLEDRLQEEKERIKEEKDSLDKENKIKKRFACREYGVLKKDNGVEIHFGTVNVIKKYPSEMPAPLAR